MISKIIAASLALGGLALGQSAQAEIITIDYSGTINNASIDGAIPGTSANYLNQTISGQFVVNTSQISGTILNFSDFGPTTTTIVGNGANWITGTANVTSRGLAVSVGASSSSSIFYPSTLPNPPGVWYSTANSAGFLSLELGNGTKISGFAANGVGSGPFGTGEYAVTSSANPNGLDFLTFTVDELSSTVSDADGPGFTDPASVPVIGSTDTICDCTTLAQNSSGNIAELDVDEPSTLAILLLGLAAIGGRSLLPGRRGAAAAV
jgi:hypothetical protein